MNFELIVTIGPAVLQAPEKLRSIHESGTCIYRINGAHVNPKDLQTIIDQIRQIIPQAKLMIDLPGNKIRTANLADPIRLVKGESFNLYSNQVNFPGFYQYVTIGDTVLANDSLFTLEIIEKNETTLKLLSHSDGLLQTNKGLHVRGIHRTIPFLFEKDQQLIQGAIAANLEFISLSFVRNAADIQEALNLIPNTSPVKVISKIETQSALDHLDDILSMVEHINVDRGDLSSETGVLGLPDAVEKIVQKGKKAKKKIFLATQFLKNMEINPVPLLSEVSDLYQTLKKGINGIQLSEETAVGRHPVECVKLVFDMVNEIKK